MTEEELFNEYRKSNCKSFSDFLINKIAELEKENAELKERIQTLEQIKKEHTDYTIKVEEERTSVKEQLTKAIELLNEFLDFESSCMELGIYISDKIRAEAEQFLKDSEVKK